MATASSNIGIPRGAITIAPSNTMRQPCREVYVGGAGNVAVRFRDGSEAVYLGCVVGTKLQGEFTHILLTGTTATNMVGHL